MLKAPLEITETLKDYLEANFLKPVSVKDFEELTGFSLRTINKHFRDVYGITPFQYYLERRMNHLIEHKNEYNDCVSLGMFARRMGFETGNDLKKEVCKRLGLTLAEFLATDIKGPWRYNSKDHTQEINLTRGWVSKAELFNNQVVKRREFIVEELSKRVMEDCVVGKMNPKTQTVSYYATLMGYEQPTVSKAFKQVLGISFIEFIRKTRYEAIKADIVENKPPVKDIVKRWGFSGTETLSNLVKHNTGQDIYLLVNTLR